MYKIPVNNGFGYQIMKTYKRLQDISLCLTSENLQKSDLDFSESLALTNAVLIPFCLHKLIKLGHISVSNKISALGCQ